MTANSYSAFEQATEGTEGSRQRMSNYLLYSRKLPIWLLNTVTLNQLISES